MTKEKAIPDENNALERLDADEDLLKLEEHLGRFNIFDALGIARFEIRHSNFLAFILDPAESHGCGQLFLRAFLTSLLNNVSNRLHTALPVISDEVDLQSVDVRREWEHIDLLLVCKQPPFVVAIENKVDSQEHSDQLYRYRQVIESRYQNITAFYFYLTPERKESSESSWLSYSYTEVYKVLRTCRERNKDTIAKDVLVFIDHYLHLLETRFMKDETRDELCQRVYKKHRQAFDLILERARKQKYTFFDEAIGIINNDNRWHVFGDYKQMGFIQFLPQVWMGWLPKIGTAESGQPEYWLFAEIGKQNQKPELYSTVVIGPLNADIADNREKIISKLREKAPASGFRISRSNKPNKNGMTCIFNMETVYEWNEDDEPNSTELCQAIRERLSVLHRRFEQMETFVKPLCEEMEKGLRNH